MNIKASLLKQKNTQNTSNKRTHDGMKTFFPISKNTSHVMSISKRAKLYASLAFHNRISPLFTASKLDKMCSSKWRAWPLKTLFSVISTTSHHVFLKDTPSFYFLDIDECSRPGACGSNALCINTVGNHTCQCQEGFTGDPYTGVRPCYFFRLIMLYFWLRSIHHFLTMVQ